MSVPALLTALLCAAFCLAQSLNGQPTQSAPQPPAQLKGDGHVCLFDFERGEVPDCIRTSDEGRLFIAPQYLNQLSFDSHGLAAVLSLDQDLKWIYVNRKGFVIITGVPFFDNGPDTFHDGLVRTVRDGKYGYATIDGRVVIPAIYDAMNFEKGQAEVCNRCENKCAEPECEHHFFAGGEWFTVDTKGEIASAKSSSGSIRIAPFKDSQEKMASPGLFCDSGNRSYRIDSLKAVPWPKGAEETVTGLDVSQAHRITISCNGKPQQSFRFRFLDYKTETVCLFLSGLYKTAQLCNPKTSVFCQCR